MIEKVKVPEGYKQTEIGIIPEDWRVILLSDKIDIYRGGSPRPIQEYLTTAVSGVNWIKIGDIDLNAKYIEKTEKRITRQWASRSRLVFVGDFLLSNSMSFGRPYILRINECIHDGWLVLQNYQNDFNKEFLYYILSSEQIFKQYMVVI